MTNAQISAEKAVPVTPDNFNRAETDMYFGVTIKRAGGLGKFDHHREIMSINNQTVIRANRDTLYSAAVFDLDAGPVTVTTPDAGKRFMSMQIFDEDQYSPMVSYGAGVHTLTRKEIGTRYIVVAFRTFIDPTDPKDLEKAHTLQDSIKVSQASSGRFEVPAWDQASQNKVRDALLALSATVPVPNACLARKTR